MSNSRSFRRKLRASRPDPLRPWPFPARRSADRRGTRALSLTTTPSPSTVANSPSSWDAGLVRAEKLAS